jgi:hypothetical protein
MPISSEPGADVRSAIAIEAARLIADEGCDYGTARRRAAARIAGTGTALRSLMPDDATVESALREHLRLFAAETQPALLDALRQLAIQLMQRLAEFNPHLAGAVLNGTATEHSDIHLQLFAESAKDVEIFLLNEGVAFDVAAGDNSPGGSEETIHFVVQPARSRGMPARVGVRLAVHDVDGVRVAPRHRSADTTLHRVEQLGRANLKSVRELVADIAAKAGKATDGT